MLDKVVMIGTPTCVKCKSIHPTIEEFCSNRCIQFSYYHANQAPADLLAILTEKKILSAPAFLLYRGDEVTVVTGDEVFIELENLK